jgi:amidase
VSEHLEEIQWLQVESRRVAQWWSEKLDLLLTPTIAEPPPPLGTLVMTPEDPDRGFQRLTDLVQFTPVHNIAGQPAVSLPLYWNSESLPIGIQSVAPFGREDLLIPACLAAGGGAAVEGS